MSQAGTNVAILNGFYKELYADKLEHLIPEGVKALVDVEFISRDKQPGNAYHQPVVLGLEHGFSFGGDDGEIFSLDSAVSSLTKDASVKGFSIVLRGQLGYTAMSRASQSKQAFMEATKYKMENMVKSFRRLLETQMFYGQSGLGIVSSVLGSDLTLTTASWASGIFTGSENMPIEVRSSGGTLRGSASIVSVNLDTRVLSLDSVIAGVVATDIVYRKGSYNKEMAGMYKILTNTGSLFGIDASEFALWKGTEHDAGADKLSFEIIQDAISKAVPKGLEGSVKCYINPRAWADLITEQAALRRYDSSYDRKKSENGAESIVFHGPQGLIEIVPSIFVKESHAFVINPDEWSRIGSTDMTMKIPGRGDEFFRELDNSAGVEYRAYSDQSLFCYAPARNILIFNIDNDA